MQTKTKILNAALDIYSKEGLTGVKLQSIADEVGISVGNLAYHYKSKDDIVLKLYESIESDFMHILESFRKYDTLFDLENQLDMLYSFSVKYPFYFIDQFQLTESLGEVGNIHQKLMIKLSSQLFMQLKFQEQRGVLKPEKTCDFYKDLSDNLWCFIMYHSAKEMIKSIRKSREEFKKSFWIQIEPYFSKTGEIEYQKVVIPTVA